MLLLAKAELIQAEITMSGYKNHCFGLEQIWEKISKVVFFWKQIQVAFVLIDLGKYFLREKWKKLFI